MAVQRKTYQHAFAGGHMSSRMFGHIEDQGYRTGWADALNMIPLPTGAATKRPQFEFVAAAKSGVSAIRKFPFHYGDGDSYSMEWGSAHVRFFTEGQPLTYATPVPVASVDLGANTFTTTAAHGFSVDDQVRITHKGVNIPGDLATGTTYYVLTVPTSTTFTLSATLGGATLDLITHSTIDDTSFWLQEELPREYVQARNVTRSGNNLDSAFAHGLVATSGDPVHFTTDGMLPATTSFTFIRSGNNLFANTNGMSTGGAFHVTNSGGGLPTGLSANTTYYARVINTNEFSVHTTQAGALAGSAQVTLSSAGTGTHTAHRTTLLVGAVYYANYVDTDSFRVATTKADAIAGTNLLTFSGAGYGTHTFHYAYYAGDYVWGGSLTLAGSTSSRLFWSFTDLPTAIPTVSDWHQMPHDGTYELLHGLGAAGLAAMNYDQSFDEFTFTSQHGPAYTLVRDAAEAPSGSHATDDAIRFAFRRVDTAPGPDAPTWGSIIRDFGQYHTITFGDGSPTATNVAVVASTGASVSGAAPALVAGDVVYMEASLGTDAAVTGISGTPGFFLIAHVGELGGTGTTQDLRFRTIQGGAEVSNSSGVDQGAVIRVVGSSSRGSQTYVVTALDANGDESEPSAELVVNNILDVAGSSNILVWSEVVDAVRYRVYKQLDEAFGLLAETDALTFTDDNIGPDLLIQPPTYDDTLESEYPAAVGSFQQRGWLAGTDEQERGYWASKTGTRWTMTHHERTPLATDRINYDVAVTERTLIRHIVSAAHLWLMTSSAEIRLTGMNTDAIVANAPVDSRAMSQIGCSGVRPIVANSNILFVGEDDQHVYELPSQVTAVIDPPDLSVRAADLFDGFTIVQSARQRSPVPIEWFLRSDGKLLGLTYMPQQEIRGWHLHEAAGTDAFIMSICVVPESDGDRLYAAIRRTIDGQSVIYIERMARIEAPDDLEDCKYLDSCVTYDGAATTTIDGLDHLEGETVYAVGDGRLLGEFTVTSGAITLPQARSLVHVGLLYEASLRTLPASVLIEGYGKGNQMQASEVTLRVDRSGVFSAMPYSDTDDEFSVTRTPINFPDLSATALRTKDVSQPIDDSWGRNGQIVLTSDVPLPMTIVSLTLGVNVGGPR